ALVRRSRCGTGSFRPPLARREHRGGSCRVLYPLIGHPQIRLLHESRSVVAALELTASPTRSGGVQRHVGALELLLGGCRERAGCFGLSAVCGHARLNQPGEWAAPVHLLALDAAGVLLRLADERPCFVVAPLGRQCERGASMEVRRLDEDRL